MLSFAAAALALVSASAPSDSRVQLKLDPSEAEAVLAILSEARAGKAIAEERWKTLFATEPYRRLKKRELGFQLPFTDEAFQKFVLSPELSAKAPALAATLDEWKKVDLATSARRVLAYLPADAVICATVYPVIKPGSNSFVFETKVDPAIFLFLDSEVKPEKFANTVAHELHHIGFASVKPAVAAALPLPTPGLATALDWAGAFGEGFAMLAAAGSPDIHPHAESLEKDRRRWDHDMAGFNGDLKAVEAFFLDILDGKLKTDEETEKRGMEFFGVQGAWYTVGYRMAIVIEKHDGRAALIACMADPRRLLSSYNRDAADLNSRDGENLALWSEALLSKFGAPPAS